MKFLDRIRQMKNRAFMEAAAAAGAMVAAADGLVYPEETAKLLEFIRLEESLGAFDAGEVLLVFEKYVERFEFDPRLGKEQAFAALRRIERRSDEARLVVLLSIAIATSDHEFTIGQKRIIREICTVLGLRDDEFELDGPPPRWNVPHRPRPESGAGKQKKKPDLTAAPDWMRRTDIMPPPLSSTPHTEKRNPAPPEFQDLFPEPGSAPEPKSHPPPLPAAPDFLPEQYCRRGGSEDAGRKADEKQARETDAIPEWMRRTAHSRAGAAEGGKKRRNAAPKTDLPKTDLDDGIPDWMKK